MNSLIYKVHQNYIEFIAYPFKCSSVYKNRRLDASDIVDATENFWPDLIRTTDDELIIIGYRQEEKGEHKKLPRFYDENNIVLRKDVVNIWGHILEPFLDTEYSEDHLERDFQILEKHGISRSECESVRKEVNDRMIAYNFTSCLWEWVNLDLYDVLKASIGVLSGEKYQLNDKDFEEFYYHAMNIGIKGFKQHD